MEKSMKKELLEQEAVLKEQESRKAELKFTVNRLEAQYERMKTETE